MNSARPLVALAFSCLWGAACMVAGTPPPANSAGSYGPPPGDAGTIHVVGGTYGASCGQPRGNVTPHLAATCGEHQQRCPYRVDHQVIGDPAHGCGKDYVAEWTCGGAPELFRTAAPAEAGYGSVVELACPGFGATASPPPPAQSPPMPPPTPPRGAAAIHVVAGSYGMNCRATHGNTTAHLQQTCEGRPDCGYRIDHKVIGDPAYGCRKDYVAEWTCGDNPRLNRATAPPEAGFGSIVTLTCGTPPDVLSGPVLPPGDRPGGGGPIVIREGSYGPNCNAPRGNVTGQLARACNGQQRCAYRVDYKVLGDPAQGCGKEYVAEWTCGRHAHVHRAVAPPEAGYGSVVEISCP